MNRITSPWCELTDKAFSSEPQWFKLRSNDAIFCDTFWKYFQWDRPEPDEQMRLIFSVSEVEGAESSFFTRDSSDWAVEVALPWAPRHRFGLRFHERVDDLLDDLLPNAVFDEPYVLSWWPEYR